MALTDDIIFSCPMTEASGKSIFDRSGNNFHFLPFTNEIPATEVTTGQYWRLFGIGGAATNRHMRFMPRCCNAMAPHTTGRAAGWRTVGPWTISFQVKFTRTSATETLLGLWTTPNKCFFLRKSSGGALTLYWSIDGTNQDMTLVATHTTNITDTNAHTVIVSWDGTDISINIDGTRQTFTQGGAYYGWADSTYVSFGGVPGLSAYSEMYVRNLSFWLRAIGTTDEASIISNPAAAQTAPGSLPAIDVWVLAGQSNANQKGVVTDVTEADYYEWAGHHYLATPSVSTYGPACWGPSVMTQGNKYFGAAFGVESSFIKHMAAKTANDIAVLQLGVDSIGLSPSVPESWYPGNDTWDAAIAHINNAMAELAASGRTATIKGTIWVHGETDASSGNSASYATWMATFISTLRAYYVTQNYTTDAITPFLLNCLSDYQVGTTITQPQKDAMEAAQLATAAANDRCYTFNTDDLVTIVGDILHFSSPSVITLGDRFSEISSVVYGRVCWGHDTGVEEENIRNFENNWQGTAEIVNAGVADTEKLSLDASEYMETSDIIYTDVIMVTLQINKYLTGDSGITLKYRHGATPTACLAASWTTYTVPFESLGFVQIKLEAPA